MRVVKPSGCAGKQIDIGETHFKMLVPRAVGGRRASGLMLKRQCSTRNKGGGREQIQGVSRHRRSAVGPKTAKDEPIFNSVLFPCRRAQPTKK